MASITKEQQLREALIERAKSMHDLLLVMQVALIEWKHGKGAEAGFQWLVNTLRGPGLLPSPDEPYGKEAQAYFDANKSDPFPTCFCGRPSNQLWMSQGFCSQEHYVVALAKTLN